MTSSVSFSRLAGVLALVAGPLAWAGLALGLSLVGYDFESFSDPAAVLALGQDAAFPLRLSFWLSLCGSYLFLVPLALWLEAQFDGADALTVRGYTLCGLAYLGLGAVGSAILAAVWPMLILLAADAAPPEQATLLVAFQMATAIAEDGLHGMLQNVVGAVWFLGIGTLLWRTRRSLGAFTCGLGVMLVLTSLGTLVGVEALSLVGLTGTILLSPLWGMGMGLMVLRTPPQS